MSLPEKQASEIASLSSPPYLSPSSLPPLSVNTLPQPPPALSPIQNPWDSIGSDAESKTGQNGDSASIAVLDHHQSTGWLDPPSAHHVSSLTLTLLLCHWRCWSATAPPALPLLLSHQRLPVCCHHNFTMLLFHGWGEHLCRSAVYQGVANIKSIHPSKLVLSYDVKMAW